MLWVNVTDGFLDTVVEGNETDMVGVCWLIQRIVSGDDRVAAISFGDSSPEIDYTVLELPRLPKESFGDPRI